MTTPDRDPVSGQSAPGFQDVDAQDDPARMVATMDATAGWPAVQHLRAWERRQLALQPGERLLDVGCGDAGAAVALAADLLPGGSVLGIDRSEEMLAAGRQRAEDNGLTCVELRTGDATALDEPDASFDAARSERTFQWLDDPAGAMAEMVRVVRPGGRLVVADSDWRTFAVDHPDSEALAAFLGAMSARRGEAAGVGGALRRLARDAGLVDVRTEVATHVWDAWDPDSGPAAGFLPVRRVVAQLAEDGALDLELGRRFADGLEDAARRDRLFMTLTMVAVYGRRPA